MGDLDHFDDPLLQMKRVVVALGVEVPAVVWQDVKETFNALSEHVQLLRSALTLACDAGWYDGAGARRHYMVEAERLYGQPPTNSASSSPSAEGA